MLTVKAMFVTSYRKVSRYVKVIYSHCQFTSSSRLPATRVFQDHQQWI